MKMIPSGLISTTSGSRGASRMSAASLGNASEDKPWKDLDQSTRLGSVSLRVRFEEGGEDRDDSVPFAEAVELTLDGDGVGETVSAAKYEVGL